MIATGHGMATFWVYQKPEIACLLTCSHARRLWFSTSRLPLDHPGVTASSTKSLGFYTAWPTGTPLAGEVLGLGPLLDEPE